LSTAYVDKYNNTKFTIKKLESTDPLAEC